MAVRDRVFREGRCAIEKKEEKDREGGEAIANNYGHHGVKGK